MAIIAILADFLLFIAALGSSWWWRPADQPAPGQPFRPWMGSSAFLWGIFGLALVLTWPIIKALA